MKNFKSVIFLFILFSLHAHAGLPVESAGETKTSLSYTIKIGRPSWVDQSSLQQTPSSLIFRSASLDAGYVSGLQKKTETSSVEGLLNWNFKVKFKLNRNMNIIFSYN